MNRAEGAQIEHDAAVARRLQRLLDGESIDDDVWTAEDEFCVNSVDSQLNPDSEESAMLQALQGLGLSQHNEDSVSNSNGQDEKISDEMLAIAFQASLAEEAYIEARAEMDRIAFAATSPGRAWSFVARIVELHNQLTEEAVAHSLVGFIEPVARDDIVALTERLLETQAEFWNSGKPYQVDLGYHYTSEENISRIQTNGLLSKTEREKRNIQATYHGSSYGEGVYTGNNAKDFYGSYGNVGLLVLRLRGNLGVFRACPNPTAVDTFTNEQGSIVVLRQSSQCVAVLRFDGSKLNSNRAWELLNKAHEAVQKLADDLFNQEPAVKIPEDLFLDPILKEPDSHTNGAPPAKLGLISYTMPATLDHGNRLFPEFYTIVKPRQDEQCAVCLVPYNRKGSGAVVRLEHCRHEFHLDCLKEAAARKDHCPLCRQSFHGPTPRGKMPTGIMTVTRKPDLTCSGHGHGSFEIQYCFPKGRQKLYHPNPGSIYPSTTRTAYLPDNKDGRRLLSRLEEAFRHGLCFTVGTSITSGKSNVITWASIPHKTNNSGGVRSHGFPDALYFRNCHAALDALQVKPASTDCIAGDSQNTDGSTER